MTDQRTTKELADALKEMISFPEDLVIDDRVIDLVAEAATALRAMDGERIEGWATRKGIFKPKLTPTQVCPNVHMWSPAVLTILTPQGGETDE